MSIFIDTSAFYAVLDADDQNHKRAKEVWEELLASGETLVTSNYIIVETHALLRSRLGIQAVRGFYEDIFPVPAIAWVDEVAHAAGVGAALAVGRHGPSLVDCVSFEIMRHFGIEDSFTFDQHFSAQGFTCRP